MSLSSAGWAKTYARGLRLLDTLLLALAGVAALRISKQTLLSPVSGGTVVENLAIPYWSVLVAAVLGWSILLEASGTRRPQVFARGMSEFVGVVNSAGVVFLVSSALAFLVRAEPSRLFIGWFLALGVLFIFLVRVLARRFIWFMRARNRMLTTVLIVGSRSGNRAWEDEFARTGSSGYRLVGTLDLSAKSLSEGEDLATVVNKILNSQTEPDLVVLSDPKLVTPQVMEELASRLELVPVAFAVVATPAGVSTARLRFQSDSAAPFLRVSDIHLGSLSRSFKRVLDLALSSSALVLLAPIIFLFSLLVKLDSPGPAFFRQERVGQFGRGFVIYKFRTMFVDAEERRQELESRRTDAGNHVLFKLKQDPRVTRVGRMLRKWSLDELPQLFNVLLGQMSLVGPRPPLASEVEDYEGATYRRLAAKPGLTGLWQVSGRSDLSWEESVRLDLHYVENWSPLLDLAILIKTIPAVLGRRGAY